MIPEKLIIEGLYSYQEKQEIDFARLTEAGLFGIFGTVGSGKSSILEAITYALYESIERLGSNDTRHYNMMNLRSNRLYIDFEFRNYEDRLFRITKEIKRNSRNFSDIRTPVSSFYENIEGSWKPLESPKIKDIIGLSYDNFKRTIIIPQGRFREFIELGHKDRTAMVMEIFDLRRFDLYDKGKKLETANKSSLDQLQGQLGTYEEVTVEALEALREGVTQAEGDMQRYTDHFNTINQNYQQYLGRRNEAEQLARHEEKFNALAARENEIEALKIEVARYEAVFMKFDSLLRQEVALKEDLLRKKAAGETLRQSLAGINTAYEDTLRKLETLRPQFDALPRKNQEAVDLENIRQLMELDQKINAARKSSAKGKEFVESAQRQKEEVASSIKTKETGIAELKAGKTDTAYLVAASEWYLAKRALLTRFQDNDGKAREIQDKITICHEEMAALGIDLRDFNAYFTTQLTDINTEKTNLHQKLEHLKLEQRLGEYAHALHDGQPCPLCGSLDHPHVNTGEDVTGEIRTITTALQDVENRISRLNDLKSRAEVLTSRMNMHNEQYAESLMTKDKLHQEMEALRQRFAWPDLDPDDDSKLVAKKKESEALEARIAQEEKELKDLQKKLDEVNVTLDKYTVRLNELEKEEVACRAQFTGLHAMLKFLKYEDHAQSSVNEISAMVAALQAENKAVEADFKAAEASVNDLKTRRASEEASLQAIVTQMNELQEKMDNITVEIQEKIKQSGYSDREEVVSILAKTLDTDGLKKEFEEFGIAFGTLKSKIADLKEKLQDFDNSDALYEEKTAEFESADRKVKEANARLATIRAEYERKNKEYEQKKSLLEQQEVLQRRAANIATLMAMFKAQGFVQYISTIYLRQLCDHANVRFHRMTRGQLSLQLNDKNDFEVIDYLNEGRVRSVKTLSGGQSFQVSLSLALALAESAQSHSKADRNFFFIDEGFGTQDAESVNIVFDTLSGLRKENRIVGIISHVEELKDRIPLALQVTKDEERGSYIEMI